MNLSKNLRGEGYFAHCVGHYKTHRDNDQRRQSKFGEAPQFNFPQPIGDKDDQWDMDDVDSIAVLRQELAQAVFSIDKAAEQREQAQEQSDSKD